MNLGTATTLANGKLTYHSTVVCEALDNGKTRLNSGGWKTATTKKRMNQYAEMMGHEWRVYQHNREWFVETYKRDNGQLIGAVVEFSDGMEV